ncbi:hypothetical protein JCM5353_008250 [Sporobolomyces roseus]
MVDGWVALSRSLGWVYTIAWSGSFYPQVILNYRRKSISGYSLDFAATNPIGHIALLIVNLSFMYSSTVRREYQERHDGHFPQVQLNDVIFSAHASCLATLTFLQCFLYKRDSFFGVSIFNRIFLLLVLLSSTLLAVLASNPEFHKLEYLDVITFLSWIKLYISFSKYVPQVKLNYQRKSTVGWSIENILLDLTGGTLSLAQLVLDSWISHDWNGITGNPGKLGLSVLTLGFDFIFILQHFVLYRHSTSSVLRPTSSDDAVEEGRTPSNRNTRGEREPLLDSSR